MLEWVVDCVVCVTLATWGKFIVNAKNFTVVFIVRAIGYVLRRKKCKSFCFKPITLMGIRNCVKSTVSQVLERHR